MKQAISEGLTGSKQSNNSRHDIVVASLIINTFFFGTMMTVAHYLPSLKLYRYLATWHHFKAPTGFIWHTHFCYK